MSGFVEVGNGMRMIRKTPEARLYYDEDWGSWLPTGYSLSNAVWTGDTGLVLSEQTHTQTRAQVFITEGTLATSYFIKCTITATNGTLTLTESRTFRVDVMVRGD